MKDRIKQVMELQQMSQKDFAQYLGISQGTLSSIFSERTQPTLPIVLAILEKFPNIQTNWLLNGIGNMTKTDTAERQENSLFDFDEPKIETPEVSTAPIQNETPSDIKQHEDIITKIEKPSPTVIVPTVKKREIKEIRIFFDDGTYETFEPK
ncbi:MAG: helix-turn-helix transcriptional regulator [Prevotella sp.]|nr:helix-turn-helix transcriptional regulator [Candidatus Equicola stercoris]